MSGDVERALGEAVAKALPGVPVYDSQGRRLGGLDIEGVLAGHPQENARPKSHDGDPWKYDGTYVCACGEEYEAAPGIGGAFRGHRAHVAAVLREQVAAAQVEARADERARIAAGIKRERDNYYTDTQNEGFDVAGRIARNGGHL